MTKREITIFRRGRNKPPRQRERTTQFNAHAEGHTAYSTRIMKAVGEEFHFRCLRLPASIPAPPLRPRISNESARRRVYDNVVYSVQFTRTLSV